MLRQTDLLKTLAKACLKLLGVDQEVTISKVNPEEGKFGAIYFQPKEGVNKKDLNLILKTIERTKYFKYPTPGHKTGYSLNKGITFDLGKVATPTSENEPYIYYPTEQSAEYIAKEFPGAYRERKKLAYYLNKNFYFGIGHHSGIAKNKICKLSRAFYTEEAWSVDEIKLLDLPELSYDHKFISVAENTRSLVYPCAQLQNGLSYIKHGLAHLKKGSATIEHNDEFSNFYLNQLKNYLAGKLNEEFLELAPPGSQEPIDNQTTEQLCSKLLTDASLKHLDLGWLNVRDSNYFMEKFTTVLKTNKTLETINWYHDGDPSKSEKQLFNKWLDAIASNKDSKLLAFNVYLCGNKFFPQFQDQLEKLMWNNLIKIINIELENENQKEKQVTQKQTPFLLFSNIQVDEKNTDQNKQRIVFK